MNWLDLALLAVWIILVLIGLWKGLIKTLFPLIGIILGIFLAGQFHTSLAGELTFIESENISRIAAFAIIFVAVLIGVSILGAFLRKSLQTLALGWVDRIGGIFGGLVIGWAVASCITYLLARYVALPAELPANLSGTEAWLQNWKEMVGIRQQVSEAIEGSKLAGFFLHTFPYLLKILPDEFDVVRRFFGK